MLIKSPRFKTVGKKLVFLFSSVIILALSIFTIIAVLEMSSALQKESLSKLKTIHNEKQIQLLDIINKTSNDCKVIINSLDTINALHQLIRYHEEMNTERGGEYVLNGVESQGVSRGYEDIYRELNSQLYKYSSIYGYSDVYIICAKHGHVMYSNSRADDLGSNLLTGPYKDSGLAELWGRVVEGKDVFIQDMSSYEAKSGAASMFVGGPIIEDSEFLGVCILQIDSNNLTNVLGKTEGMGDSGEIYCVGEDGLIRSTIRNDPSSPWLLKKKISSPASRILHEETIMVHDDIFTGYYGEKVISVYSHATIDEKVNADFDWALIAEIKQSEVMAPVMKLTFVLILIALVIMALSIWIIMLFSRSLSTPIKAGAELAEQVSMGYLNTSVDDTFTNRDDELGLLGDSLQFMITNLKEIVGKVITGSSEISSASLELASGNQDLSHRTEEQASALEETSAAIEEMNSSIRSNADNTVVANNLTGETLEKTKKGSEAVQKMIHSMNNISTSSKRIADIIEVINNIAFQTNLLALNASIEAARAGDQGKGFAVVAVEVRKLAKRSDRAASEIAEIIKNSNEKVDEGVEVADRAGNVLSEISDSVKKVSALVGEISASSQEQLSSVDQIEKTLQSLDDNTQRNAALVEQTAAATEQLSSQAQELNRSTEFFKMDNNADSVESSQSNDSESEKKSSSPESPAVKKSSSKKTAASQKESSKKDISQKNPPPKKPLTKKSVQDKRSVPVKSPVKKTQKKSSATVPLKNPLKKSVPEALEENKYPPKKQKDSVYEIFSKLTDESDYEEY